MSTIEGILECELDRLCTLRLERLSIVITTLLGFLPSRWLESGEDFELFPKAYFIYEQASIDIAAGDFEPWFAIEEKSSAKPLPYEKSNLKGIFLNNICYVNVYDCVAWFVKRKFKFHRIIHDVVQKNCLSIKNRGRPPLASSRVPEILADLWSVKQYRALSCSDFLKEVEQDPSYFEMIERFCSQGRCSKSRTRDDYLKSEMKRHRKHKDSITEKIPQKNP